MEIIKKTVVEDLAVEGADFKGSVRITDGALTQFNVSLLCGGDTHSIDICSEEQLRDLAKELNSVVEFIDSKKERIDYEIKSTNHVQDNNNYSNE